MTPAFGYAIVKKNIPFNPDNCGVFSDKDFLYIAKHRSLARKSKKSNESIIKVNIIPSIKR